MFPKYPIRFMKPMIRFILLGIFLWPVAAHLQTTELSLVQAQDYALKNAYQAKSAQYDAQVAALQTEELIGVGLPQISGSLQYQNFIDIPTQLVPAEFFGGAPGSYAPVRFGLPQNMTVGLSASQLLFNGSWLVGLEASRAYADLKNKQKIQTEKSLKSDVANAYHLALIAGENLKVLQSSREILAKTLSDTRALFENGFLEEQDVDQLQLTLNDLDSRIAYAEQQVKVTHDLLKFTIGMPLATDLKLSDTRESMVAQASEELLSAPFSADSHIDYQVTLGALGMQEINLKNERAKKLPTLAAFYNLQTNAQRPEFNFMDSSKPWFPIQLWGVQLNVPIFSGLSRNKSIGKAKVEIQRMQDLSAMTREA
ncbi:MAG: hypothetical protein RL220_1379, partial [Bacteroidota bacterium]